MKRGFYILLIMCTAIMVVSCDKTKSYTDMLKAQEKAIDRLRADSGLVFLEEFPTDSIFKENEFVKLDNDVYLNVIDTMNVCKDNALVFEDSAVGVQAAWSAGIPVVMVPDLVQATEIQQRQTVKIISSLHEGIPLLDEIQKDGMKYERCI